MLAYMIAEWREWTNDRLAKTIVAGIVVIALIGVLFSVHPFAMMTTMCLESIWLGWYLGNRYWRGTLSRSRFLGDRLRPWRAVAGKLGAAALIGAVHAFCMAPVLVTVALLWGVSAGGILAGLAICFGSFLASLSLGFFFSLALPAGEGFFGTVAMGLWLTLTGAIAPARVANPIAQVWLCMGKSRSITVPACALILFLAAGAILALCAPLLKGARTENDE